MTKPRFPSTRIAFGACSIFLAFAAIAEEPIRVRLEPVVETPPPVATTPRPKGPKPPRSTKTGAEGKAGAPTPDKPKPAPIAGGEVESFINDVLNVTRPKPVRDESDPDAEEESDPARGAEDEELIADEDDPDDASDAESEGPKLTPPKSRPKREGSKRHEPELLDERTDAIGDITDDSELPDAGVTEHVKENLPIHKSPSKTERIGGAPGRDVVVLPATPERKLRRWKIREALAYHYERPVKVTDRTPWGVMHGMIGYGVDAQLIDAAGRRFNSVGYLCYNYAAKGQRLLHLKEGKIAAEVGPGIQGHQGQFLAMLAQSRVEPSYPMRVEGKHFKVQDLIDYEKRTCTAGTELTFKLIALSHYLHPDETWLDAKGQTWSISRLIQEELKQPIVGAACGGNHRLTGFSYAVAHREQRGLPLAGQWLRAKKFIDDYHEYLFTMQNPDGSFSTQWYRQRVAAPDQQRRLQTTGHMLEWAVYSLPDDKLEDPRVLRAVDYTADLLLQNKSTEWEIGPLGHALHALAIYDERLYGGKPGQRPVQLSKDARSKDAPMQR